jgi:hypothetical protein
MNINQKDIYAVSAYTIDNNPEGTKTLIRKYGVVLPANASKADIDKAFAALLKTSKTFRRDFAALAQESISNNNNFLGFLNFVQQGNGTSLNKVYNGFVSQGKGTSLDDIFIGASAGAQAGSTDDPAKSKDDKNKNGVSWSDYLDPDTVKRVINTGLNVWASREGTTADTTNNINQGRADIPNNPNTPPPASGGMGTGTIVLIVVGVLGALGAIVYFATKKK